MFGQPKRREIVIDKARSLDRRAGHISTYLLFSLSVVSLTGVLMMEDSAAGDAPKTHENANNRTALASLRWQADAGNIDAMFSLGDLYLLGDGVPKDHAKAVKWYRMAAERGYAKAQSYLAEMYRRGDGIAQDKAEAVRWYRKAAEQRFPAALNALGDMYLKGEGVPKDENEAMKWHRKFDERVSE